MKTHSLILSLVLFVNLAKAQHLLQGRIFNENGEPLSGATVFDEVTLAGTVSDAEGNYSMKLKTGDHLLVVKYLGYSLFKDSIYLNADLEKNVSLVRNPYLTGEVVIEATRARITTPMTVQNVSKEEIEALNLAQDLPILLNQTVSTVTTSDAGAGVGYTGLRIRGSDATRINVTINGVPVNDAESHGVFWVNMPDLASSTENIQIQRGVGTSSNGAAAFGASINVETSGFDTIPSAEVNNTYGSFNTRRHNALVNSGLINNCYNFEGRLSYIGSDGYIDRAASDLKSYYFSGGYFGEKLMVKAITFGGNEITQQAWYGTPESRISGDSDAMLTHAANNGYNNEQTLNLLNSGRTFNYYLYDNEVDNYSQSHYHLITALQVSEHLSLNITGHYTRGLGYFEQFKQEEDLADFELPYSIFGTDTVMESDLIVRRWLDNHFYGGVYALQYDKKRLRLTLGGSANEYVGDHYGEVIWAEFAGDSKIRQRYYASTSKKLDVSNYVKAEFLIGKFSLYGDAQVRFIDYVGSGTDNDLRPINIDAKYLFFNPKAGLSYQFNSKQLGYLSLARASREPVRNDFNDALPGVVPKPEYLTDVEAGWSFRSARVLLNTNLFYMHYTNQLVLTGEVNDVGSPVRANVPESYRAGMEISADVKITSGLYWRPNLSLSRNKINAFTELIYDYTNGFEILEVAHSNTDIAFSPNIIAGSQIGYKTSFGLEAAVLTKYVGSQFLDNTSNPDRNIDAFLVNDLRISYGLETLGLKRVELTLLVNNFLNEMYASSGYTYSYIYQDLITENFYYPQAGINWLAGLKLRF